MESILITIKKLLGIPEDYEEFDPDIITHINSVLFILYQEGILKEVFNITGPGETWQDMLGTNYKNYSIIRSYIYLRVRLLFDSASMSSSVMDSTNELIRELEWRLYVMNSYS